MFIILDTFPASSTAKRTDDTGSALDLCARWIGACESSGHRIFVPAVSYFEVLRELERKGAIQQIERLKLFCRRPDRFLPLSTEHLELAAKLWAKARQEGRPTADPQALDCDVILAAQALSLGLRDDEYVVATTNPGHLGQFVPVALWETIGV